MRKEILSIRTKDIDNPMDKVVLCHLPNNRCTPYVTWRTSGKNIVPSSEMFWGHYHKTFESAERDFMSR